MLTLVLIDINVVNVDVNINTNPESDFVLGLYNLDYDFQLEATHMKTLII